MRIKDQYENLINKEISIALLDQAKSLRDQCVLEQNLEYYYLSNLYIIDIYIDANQFDEAILIINKDFSHIDSSIYRNIYVSYLERLIYIYINKRNFAVAYKYVFEKRKYIDDKNRDDVNRWYLEMAYVYAEMNQKAKAVDNLKAIIENLPSDELLSLALNNLTKLYIDQKMIPEAKDALNQSLIITQDEEGKMYCHYLFAKICILENKYDEALVLYEDIFKHQINPDFLSIANDYIDLLIKMNRICECEFFIRRMQYYIEKTDDLVVQKEFYKNKIKLILSKNHILDVDECIAKIDELENTILAKNALDLEETYEDEKYNEIYNQLHQVTSKLEHVINLVTLAFSSENIRDILMEFSKKLETIINIDEITFVFYDHLINFLGQKDNITTYNYKKERLYERSISFDNLKNTVVEAMINHGNEIIVDLNETNLELLDVNTQKKYKDFGINYLYAIPNYRSEELFATVIYESQYTDFTALENNIILKVATKLLEIKILNTYLKINEHIYDFVLDRIITNNNIYTIIHDYNKLILSDELKKLLELKDNLISLDNYIEMIAKGDVSKYQELDFSCPHTYDLEYHLKVNDRYLLVHEQISPFTHDKILFFFSTLKIQELQMIAKPNDNKFLEKVQQLKLQTSNPEFAFSLVRIEGNEMDYDNITNVFGFPPYYLTDGTYIIILENEVNQRTLDKYVRAINKKVAIVRYPRDLVNIDEVIKFSKINLDNNITYFTDEMYQQYLKKVSINNLVKKMLTSPLEIWYQELEADKQSYEVKCKVNGSSSKDNVRHFLDRDLLIEYDEAVFNNFINNNLHVNFYLNLTVASAINLYQKKKFNAANNIIICLDHYDDDIYKIVPKLKSLGFRVFFDYDLLEYVSIYDLIDLNIDGIMINIGLDSKRRQEVIGVAKRFNLPLLTNYRYNDYEKCIYRTDKVLKEV